MSISPRAVSAPQMHVRELIELAAVLAAHGAKALGAQTSISAAAMDDYFAAAHKRQQRWTRQLRHLRRGAAGTFDARAWLEEIFVSDALACVWGALLSAHQRVQVGNGPSEAITDRVAADHAQMRSQAMRLLAGRSALTPQDAADLDRLRRSMARWIDLLVAHVQRGTLQAAESATRIDVCHFAVDPERAREFADDLAHHHSACVAGQFTAVAVASLRTALSRQLRCPSPNGELNHAVATSVVSCFPAEMFDATGAYHGLWTARLAHRAADAERILGQLLAEGAA